MMTQEKRKALKAIAIVFGGILGVYHLFAAIKMLFVSTRTIEAIFLFSGPFLTLPLSWIGFHFPRIIGYIFIVSFLISFSTLFFFIQEINGLTWFAFVYCLPSLIIGIMLLLATRHESDITTPAEK